mmetsp:Transcript_2820/g.4304  ORF Transcript_2820/g.4304 Transcript_2820/m.4304 type:complete len:159 (-) Transcript_2820:160-636(-)
MSTYKSIGSLNKKDALGKYEENLNRFARMVFRLGIIDIPSDVKFFYVYVVPLKHLVERKCYWRWEDRRFPPDLKHAGNLSDDQVKNMSRGKIKAALKLRWQKGYSKDSENLLKQKLQEHRETYDKIARLYHRTEIFAVGVDVFTSSEEDFSRNYLQTK